MADDYRFTGSKGGAAFEASVSGVAEPAYRFEGRVQAPSLDVEDAPSGDIYVFDGEVRHDDLSVVPSDVSSDVYGFNVEFVRKSLAVSGAEGCGDVYEFTLDFGCSGGPVDLSGYYRKSEVDDLLSKKASRASTLRGYGIKDVYIEGTTIHIGGESVSVGGEGGSPVLYPFEIVEYTSGKYAVKVADKFLFGDSLVSIDGFFSTGFLSARGLDDTTGSGSGGTDLPAVWKSLTENVMPYQDVTINKAHIPVLPQSKVDGLAESLSALKTLIGGKADSSQLADYVLKSTYDTGMSGKLDKSVFDKLFTVHYKEGSATEIESLELNYGTWTTGFLSARGLDDTTGSGSGGTDLPAVWESLTKNEMPYQDVTINTAHIPVLPQSKVTGLSDALSSLRAGYTGISALIPQAATADNQLADKEFVNSSIATATATFRGTFATLAALEATPADRNDYAFWQHKDEDGNTCYDKYTYTGSEWKFEYRLNNSSFTAAQWGAINSGITGALVTKLSGISDWALATSKPSYTTAEVTEKTNLYFTDARAKSALSGHTGDTTIHITAAERKAWNAKWDWNEASIKAVKVNAAGEADKLANSRKLWGNAFNGEADVNGDITLGSGKRIYFGSTSYYIELVNGRLHTNVGLYSDKFISARGVDPDAGGGSGASLPVVWASLQGNTDDYKDKTIHQAHIPTLPVSRIDGLATALAGKQAVITADSKLDYSLLKNTPTIGNGTITIKQGTNSQTFSTNQGDNKTITLTDTTYESKTAASGGTALSLVTTGEKYTWNNKQAAISDLATIRTNAATAHGWGDHSKAGYITGITKAMVESVLTGNITSHTHTFDSLTSKPTTLAGYGITDASRIFRYIIPASGNTGVRITFTAQEPVKITVSGSNQHAQLVLIGTGYGEGGFIRNNFTELVHSDSGYSWCMPDEACSVEVFSTRTRSDYVTVESPSPVTFTAISALSKTAVGRRLLNSSNYSSFALPLTGGTMSGSIRMNSNIATPLLIRNYSSQAAGGWARAIVECRVDDKNAFGITPFGNYTPGAANNKIDYVSLGFAGYNGLNLRISETDIKWGYNAIYHAGNSNLSTVPWNCSSLTAKDDVTAKAGLYGQYLEFLNIGSSSGHGGFIDFHFNGSTEDYTSRIIEDAKGQLSLYVATTRIGKSNSANLLFLRPSYNYIWADVAGGTLVLGTADGGQTDFANSAIFIKGKKVYIGGTETGNNALNVKGVAHATTGIYSDGYVSARGQDTSSDIRLKTDFRPLDGALKYILGTHFTRFRWKDGGGESVGIIAQEEQDREYGFLVRSHGEIGHLTYDYAASTALLGAALQEEDDKVEALKRRVKELENELNKLKQSNYAR